MRQDAHGGRAFALNFRRNLHQESRFADAFGMEAGASVERADGSALFYQVIAPSRVICFRNSVGTSRLYGNGKGSAARLGTRAAAVASDTAIADFHELRRAMHTGHHLHAFDLLRLDGRNVRPVPSPGAETPEPEPKAPA